jgi:hypothetical protein
MIRDPDGDKTDHIIVGNNARSLWVCLVLPRFDKWSVTTHTPSESDAARPRHHHDLLETSLLTLRRCRKLIKGEGSVSGQSTLESGYAARRIQ